MGIRYASREDVKMAMDFKDTAADNARIDRAIEAASRSVETLTRRKFYPQTATRYFDWPNKNRSRAWRLWLDADELISVTTLTAGGTTISSSDYFLEPVNSGPPYTRIEIDLASSASFESGDTHQRSIAVTGVFGANNTWESTTTLAEALDSSETGVDVTSDSLIGVGNILKVDSEIMLVTDKALKDTTVNTSGALVANKGETTVAVSDGSGFSGGELIVIDSETMLVVSVSGNNLTVKRGWDGSVLATHANPSDVYAYRTLTVERGALGTTAVSHDTATAITKLTVPPLVRSLTIAEAVTMLQNEGAGYARIVGSGENEREARGVQLNQLRKQVRAEHGRNRMRSV